MNNIVRTLGVIVMLLCSVALIAFGLFGNFGEFESEQILATLAPTRAEYKTNSKKIATTSEELTEKVSVASNIGEERATYVLNVKSKVFHHLWCGYAEKTDEENRELINISRNDLIQSGNRPCGRCKP